MRVRAHVIRTAGGVTGPTIVTETRDTEAGEAGQPAPQITSVTGTGIAKRRPGTGGLGAGMATGSWVEGMAAGATGSGTGVGTGGYQAKATVGTVRRTGYLAGPLMMCLASLPPPVCQPRLI